MARRTIHGRSRPPTLRQWTATVPETQFVALAAATAVIDSTFITSGAAPETILRSRGLLTVITDQAASSEQPFGAFGICVVSDQAIAAGIGSIPTPYTEPESDLWLLHQFFAAPMVFGSAIGFAALGQSYELDSKAMRKVGEDQTVVFVMENGNSTDGLLYRLDMRVLSKLS